MFKTLIGKFTILFWVLFVLVIIPIYLYTNFHFNAILQTSEKEKVTLTFNTLKPIIALNLSFDQQELVKETLTTFFSHQDIYSIQLTSVDGKELFVKTHKERVPKKIFVFESVITDPFGSETMATARIEYSNEHLDHLTTNIFLMLLAIFAVTLAVFLVAFFYLREDLNGLRLLSKWFKRYMVNKNISTVEIPGKSQEVLTIAMAANEMVTNISDYVSQLEEFNRELEKRVEQAIAKQRHQEQMMTHQARLAAMGEMIESIAHQWRQPLNNIGLAMANIETKFTFGSLNQKEFEDKVELISVNLRYMSDTIDDFRNFLNPERELKVFNPEQTFHDVFKILAAQLRFDKIVYRVGSDCQLQLHGNENEFKQVLLVLVNNAKDAIRERMEHTEIDQGHIDVAMSCSDHTSVIEVSDNGGGIDESIIHSIFEPYFTTKFKNQGTGIGLYLAKNIIENRMGGSITVKNIESGSCFVIKLPIREEDK